MPVEEVFADLRNKNLQEGEEERAQNLKKRIEKIKKYLSIYLYSLLGISTTGILLVLTAFFTPYLPIVAAALTAAFTAVISTLALPLLIAVIGIAVALLLSPIAAFLWKKHQVNSELESVENLKSPSFDEDSQDNQVHSEPSDPYETLKKSLDDLEEKKNTISNETENYEIEKFEIQFCQASEIYSFIEEENANYNKINDLLNQYKVPVELLYLINRYQKVGIPDEKELVKDIKNFKNEDEVDSPGFKTFNIGSFLSGKKLELDAGEVLLIMGKMIKERGLFSEAVKRVILTQRGVNAFNGSRLFSQKNTSYEENVIDSIDFAQNSKSMSR